MKYWENDKKECGTMDDADTVYPTGFRPTSKKEYDNYVESMVAPIDTNYNVFEFEDIESRKTYRMKRINNEVENVKPISMGNKLREWATKLLP